MRLSLRIFALILCAANLQAQFSTFDFDNEGWTANGDAQNGTAYYLTTGGNPGGCIKAIDLNTGISWYFVAPDCYLGKKDWAYGQKLEYDVRTTIVSTNNYTGDLLLIGPNDFRLYHNYGENAQLTWTHFSITLIESNFTVGTVNGPTATQADLLYVLSDLQSLQIRGEYHHGQDQGFLDNVKLGEIPVTNLHENICAGASLSYQNLVITEAGMYDFSVESSSGCDSLVRLNVALLDSSFSIQKAQICPGDTWTLPDGQVVSQPGNYDFIYPKSNGCDSLVRHELNFKDTSLLRLPIAICQGETYTLPDGQVVGQSGVYATDILTNAAGCDSTVAIELRVYPPADTLVQVFLTEGETYVFPDGSAVRDTNLQQSFVLQTAEGCDSTVVFVLQTVFYRVFVPNVFSPDNDGLNDTWQPFTNEFGKTIVLLRVYDRWGSLVFERNNVPANDPASAWDGFTRGKKAAPGVYVWLAEIEFADGARLKYQGDLTLLR